MNQTTSAGLDLGSLIKRFYDALPDCANGAVDDASELWSVYEGLLQLARRAEPSVTAASDDPIMDVMCDPPYGAPDLYARLVRFCRAELPLAQQQGKVAEWVGAIANTAEYEAEKFGYRATLASPAVSQQASPFAAYLRRIADLLGIFHGGDDEYVVRHAASTLDQVVREVTALNAMLAASPAVSQKDGAAVHSKFGSPDLQAMIVAHASAATTASASEIAEHAAWPGLRLRATAPSRDAQAYLAAELDGAEPVYKVSDLARAPLPMDDGEVTRLRRVVRALGMEKEVPQDDETLRGCLFSVLGMIARKLEARAPLPNSQEAVLKFAIEVEKMLCAALGREWSTSGISIESLIKELSARAPLPAENAKPVAWLKFWAAQYSMGEGNIGTDEGLEVCNEGEIGMDGKPAFPVYAAPAQAGDARLEAIAADRAARAQQKAQSIGDDPEFRELINEHETEAYQFGIGASDSEIEGTRHTLVAYIDGRTAGAAPDERVEDLGALVRKLVHALRKADPATTLADGALGYLKRKGLTGSPLRAAAPSPQPGREGGK